MAEAAHSFRHSSRANLGRLPARYAESAGRMSDRRGMPGCGAHRSPSRDAQPEYSHSESNLSVSSRSSSASRAAARTRCLEAELKSAQKIADLKKQELALDMELARKTLAVEQARAAEHLEFSSYSQDAGSVSSRSSKSSRRSLQLHRRSHLRLVCDPEELTLPGSSDCKSIVNSSESDGAAHGISHQRPKDVGQGSSSDSDSSTCTSSCNSGHPPSWYLAGGAASKVSAQENDLNQDVHMSGEHTVAPALAADATHVTVTQPHHSPVHKSQPGPLQSTVEISRSTNKSRKSVATTRTAEHRAQKKSVQACRSGLDPDADVFKPASKPRRGGVQARGLAELSTIEERPKLTIQPAAHQVYPHAKPSTVDWVQSQQSQHPMGISAMYQVKQLEVPQFSGAEKDYTYWRRRFTNLIHEDPYVSESYKLERLRHALAGSTAEDLVSGILDGPGAYEEALRELDVWYGGNDRELERQEREVLAWPKVSQEKDTEGLKAFALRLRTMLVNMRVCGIQPGRELYVAATQKIPRMMLVRYFERYDDTAGDVQQFCDWLLNRVHTLRRVDERLGSVDSAAAGTSYQPSTMKGQRPGRFKARTLSTVANDGKADKSSQKPCQQGSRGKPSCMKCSGDHHLSKCDQFKALSVFNRWNFIKMTSRICACCLSVGHWSKECRKDPCSYCGKLHHSLLHRDKQQSESKHPASVSISADYDKATSNSDTKQRSEHEVTHCGVQLTSGPSYSFMIVPVLLVHANIRFKCTALLDPASSTSYVRQSIASALDLHGKFSNLTTSVLEGREVSARREKVVVNVESCDGDVHSAFSAWVLPSVTAPVTPVDWNTRKNNWPHLQHVDFPEISSKSVDLLIGINALDLHTVCEERCSGVSGEPIARRTPLGWVCLAHNLNSTEESSDTTMCCTADTSSLENVVHQFWIVEQVGNEGVARETMSVAEKAAELQTEQTIKYCEGRFEVGIPWLENDKPHLIANQSQAKQRLSSLERSLSKNPDIEKQYRLVFEKHLEKGYIRPVPEVEVKQDGDDQWFLPHFPVVREDKVTTKVRMVFDAAVKWGGRSINDEMHTGPALQADIVRVLIKFCLEPVALVGDISEMFLQVSLRPQDRRYHRFLWWSASGDVEVFEFQRLVFGIKASPYLAGRVVKETVKQFGSVYPPIIGALIDQCMYVDDLLCCAQSESEAITIRKQVQELLAQGGFRIRKWLSSSEAVCLSIPEEDRSMSGALSVGNHFHAALPAVKTLGISWLVSDDAFTFRFDMPDCSTVTRRSVLSGLSTIFDPRGQIAPFTIRTRVLLQDIWLLDTGWDVELPSEYVRRWSNWCQELSTLATLVVPRCFKDPSLPAVTAKLSVHTFCDASDRAIAAASYIRAEYPEGEVRVTLAMAKAKPAPIRRQTIPQLELRGAVLGLKVSTEVASAVDVPVSRHVLWTDSMNVLGWIRSHSRRFKVDIGNRVSLIQTSTEVSQWRHVPGSKNPADKGTRGLTAAQLRDESTWWNGPDFLKQDEYAWPVKADPPVRDLPGEVQSKTATSLATSSAESDEQNLSPEKFSTWKKLVKVSAWVFRFVNSCQQAVQGLSKRGEKPSSPVAESPVPTKVEPCFKVYVHHDGSPANPSDHSRILLVPHLTVGDNAASERYWIARAQRDCYAPTYQLLCAGKELPASDPLVALSPCVDSSSSPPLLILSGRLKYSTHLPAGLQHPIILPAKHRVTTLLIEQEDQHCKHSVGAHHLLSNLRQKYWVVNGVTSVKAVRLQCVQCQKYWGVPRPQVMGPLPDFRTATSMKPFSRVGIDFAGPFLTKQGRGRVRAKRYVCVVTCLEIRACHLELAYSLDTESFLMCFNRFVKRRGAPELVVTDNGTNFVAAERHLREAVSSFDQSQMQHCFVNQGITWLFNPPRSPHFGGVFEVIVKAVKRALTAALSNAEVNDEELHTALVQAEELVNSRPLNNCVQRS